MGASCARAPPPPPLSPPRPPPSINASRPISTRPKSNRLQTQQQQRPNSRALPNPILLDADTHSIRTLSASQFQITSAPDGMQIPSKSPTRRPTIVPRDALYGNKRASTTRPRMDRPMSILFSDLVFKQSLGQGTYGEVSRGYWKGRKVAIKKIFPGRTSEEWKEVLADFEREVAILSKLKHPRIVQFLGFVNEPNQPLCLIFELCEGSAALLLKMVRRSQVQLTWRICLGILRDAAEAVHSLHSQYPKIIHRDLKAENLLLESDFRCKLTDFGLSRAFESRRPSKMTVCGTPCWVAPEVFRNDAYDEKIDIYSFGVLIWEILAGKKPYGDKDCADLPVLVGSKGLRPGLLPHVPPEVNELMAACWEESPSRRPDIEKVRKWLDHVAYTIDCNRRMGAPVHVANYHAINWTSPPVGFEYRPPAPPPADPKRFSRIRRHDGNNENRMSNRQQPKSKAKEDDFIEDLLNSSNISTNLEMAMV